MFRYSVVGIWEACGCYGPARNTGECYKMERRTRFQNNEDEDFSRLSNQMVVTQITSILSLVFSLLAVVWAIWSRFVSLTVQDTWKIYWGVESVVWLCGITAVCGLITYFSWEEIPDLVERSVASGLVFFFFFLFCIHLSSLFPKLPSAYPPLTRMRNTTAFMMENDTLQTLAISPACFFCSSFSFFFFCSLFVFFTFSPFHIESSSIVILVLCRFFLDAISLLFIYRRAENEIELGSDANDYFVGTILACCATIAAHFEVNPKGEMEGEKVTDF